MGDFQGWKPIEIDEEREPANHREPGRNFCSTARSRPGISMPYRKTVHAARLKTRRG